MHQSVKQEPIKNNFRSKRFNDIADSCECAVEIGGQTLNLENLSDTGGKIISLKPTLVIGESYSIKIKSQDEKVLIVCKAKIVWHNKCGDKQHYGIEFINYIVPREFLFSLDQLLFAEYELEKELASFDEIPDEFRYLVLSIENFFLHLKSHIDAIECKFETRSIEAKASLLAAVDIRFGGYVSSKLSEYGKELFDYLDHLKNKEQRERLLAFFRRELNEFYLQSPYARRAMEKPLGYAGDYEMMNQVYRNGYEGTSLFSKLIHRYTVNEAAAISVRERKSYLSEKINTAITKSKNAVVTICSVACGPAQEWVEFFDHFSLPKEKQLEIVLIDQDVEALFDARRNVQSCSRDLGSQVSIICEPVVVKDIIDNSERASAFLDRSFDMIYSAGLYDYLPQAIAKSLTATLAARLKPSGHLLVGNFHPSSPTRAICEFSIDWRLIYRTEEEVKDLAELVSNMDSSIEIDSQGIVVYLNLEKK